MNKFEKKWANKKARKNSKKEVEKFDAEPKNKKKGGLKACPGYNDHTGRKKVELTVPCPTCKRHFCSEECQKTHNDLCKAKFDFNETKDMEPLIELCKKIFFIYLDEKGVVREEWALKYELKKNASTWHGRWTMQWKHGDLAEAMRILKKNDPDFFKGMELMNGKWWC